MTSINSTYGVSKILSFNKKPAEIPYDIILELKIRYDNNNTLQQEANLKKGDNIEISTGPFTELIAKVLNVEKNNRIWLLMEYMGGTRKLKSHNEKFKYRKL